MAWVLNSSYRPPDEWLKADQTKPGTSVSTMQSGAGRGEGRGAGEKGETKTRTKLNVGSATSSMTIELSAVVKMLLSAPMVFSCVVLFGHFELLSVI